MSEFYVGYLAGAPPGIRRCVRAAVVVLLLVFMAASVLFTVAQNQFARSYFDFGKPAEFSGTLTLEPFPTLLPDDSFVQEKQQRQPYLLVAPGKFGAHSLLAGHDRKHVRLRGTLIHRDEGRMIELDPSSISQTDGPSKSQNDAQEFEEMSLTGEIVDTKCFLGVMNPGEGKVHRDCAARCLSGGIPPALITTSLDGSPRLVLLLGEDGKPLSKESFLKRVGQPVSLRGTVLKSQGLFYVRTNAARIVPLP
jgi:hypothetical protein